MVIIKLMGGLGNQMFQYAFALAYLAKGREVKFDLSYFDVDSRHGGYWLEKGFNINLVKANKKDLFYFIEKAKDETGNIGYRLKKDRFFINEGPEEEFTYNPGHADVDHAHFTGYWQNINYLKANEYRLRAHFQFREIGDYDVQNLTLKEQILNSNSISIHIRRGDYLHSPVYSNLGTEYYTKAIRLIRNRVADPCFFVFADDMEWAKENIVTDNITYVKGNGKHRCHVDMYLMSLCRHNIIANSTFSWWGGWLNSNADKMVIVPKKWFNQKKNINGFIPEKWVSL